MNKDIKKTKQTKSRKELLMDIGAWTIVILGLLLVLVGIAFGIAQMAAEIESSELVLPNLSLSFTLFLSTLIAFLIVFLAAYFLFWDKVKTSLEERRKNVEANIAITNYKAAQAEKNLKVSEEEISKAELQGKEIVSESKKEANSVKKEILAESRTQSEEMLNETRNQIEREKSQMEDQIRKEILETSLLAAEKIIEKELDAEANKKMIEELIDSLK